MCWAARLGISHWNHHWVSIFSMKMHKCCLITTSTPLFALRQEFHHPSKQLRIFFFNWIFYLVIFMFAVCYTILCQSKWMPILIRIGCLLYLFNFFHWRHMHIQQYDIHAYSTTWYTCIFNNMLFGSSCIYDHPII